MRWTKKKVEVFPVPRVTREPWGMLADETTRAFAAFVIYRDMGSERSTAKVAQRLGVTKHMTDRWSTRHKWVERVALYEAHLDKVRRDEAENEIRKMTRRHINQAQGMAYLAFMPVSTFLARIQNDANFAKAFADQINKMSAKDVIDLIQRVGPTWANALKLERLSSGQSTENVAGKHEVNAAAFNDAADSEQDQVLIGRMMEDPQTREALMLIAEKAVSLHMREEQEATREELEATADDDQ